MFLMDGLKSMRLLHFPSENDSPDRYRLLRRNIITLMLLVTILPLCFMAAVNYHQYQTAFEGGDREPPARPWSTRQSIPSNFFLAERESGCELHHLGLPLRTVGRRQRAQPAYSGL